MLSFYLKLLPLRKSHRARPVLGAFAIGSLSPERERAKRKARSRRFRPIFQKTAGSALREARFGEDLQRSTRPARDGNKGAAGSQPSSLGRGTPKHLNETWNGWVLAISGRSAFWTAPGDTALRTLVGWNIEIMLMFAIAGIVFYYMVPEERSERIHGLPARWFWASASSAFCVLVECVLNIGGLLVWKYPFWNRSLAGIWLIFVFGYFGFFAAIDLVLGMKSVRRRGRGGSGGGSSRGGARETATAAARAATRRKARVIGIIYAVPVVMNVFGFAVMGWRY